MPVLKLKAEDAQGQTQRFNLDTDADDFLDRLDAYVDAVRDEAQRPMQVQLTATTTERDDLKGVIVGEIVRRLQLAADAPADFDVEKETDFYSSLPADRLRQHYERALALKLKTAPKSQPVEGDGPIPDADDTTDADDGFGNVEVQ